MSGACFYLLNACEAKVEFVIISDMEYDFVEMGQDKAQRTVVTNTSRILEMSRH